LTNIWK